MNEELKNDKINEKKVRREGYNRVYYQKKKTKILENGKIKVFCEHCEKNISKWGYARHLNTKGHRIRQMKCEA